MTTKKHSFLKIALCLILVLAIFPIAKISTVFAETLTLKTLISSHADQEITSSLEINTNFENGSTLNGSGVASWGTPTIGSATITQVNVADLTKDEYIGYKTENDVKYSSIGTDGTTGNKYGLLFKLSESGIAGIESTAITIPANAYYVLSFNVAVPALDNTLLQYGINAKLIHEDKDGEEVITTLKAIKAKNKNYVSYAFLIQGNENVEKTVKLQFLFGNAVVGSDDKLTESKQIGYAVVDTIRMFSVSQSQFAELTEDKNCQEVSLLDQNSKYISIPNGFFNETSNKNWNLEANTKLSDLAPLDWTHTGSSNEFGVVNTNVKLFENRLTQAGLSSVNPGNPNGWDTTNYNNVLMLSNPTEAHQKLTSGQFVLAKNSYYKISFSFNTPAIEGQTNGISFQIVDTDGKTIYSQEKIYSYTEYKDDANQWATFNLFVETDTVEKKVNFIITFGTENSPAKGNAFVDEISLSKVSSTIAFGNTEENKYPLITQEGEEQKFLEKGNVSFENLKELDKENSANRTLSLFSYKPVAENNTNSNNSTSTDTNKNNETKDSSSNSALVWYVVPSVLLGVCLIGGMVIYFVRKLKIKKPKSKKPAKTQYDRKSTLNKQVEKREKEQGSVLKEQYEAELQQVQKEIESLEENYKKEKQNKHTLQSYLSKRQKLEAKEIKIKDQLNKLK